MDLDLFIFALGITYEGDRKMAAFVLSTEQALSGSKPLMI
jgi:hypothetical protein